MISNRIGMVWVMRDEDYIKEMKEKVSVFVKKMNELIELLTTKD